MYKTVVLFVFLLVLCADFVVEVAKTKNQSIFDMCLRAFMIIAFCYICEWFQKGEKTLPLQRGKVAPGRSGAGRRPGRHFSEVKR